MGSRMDIGLGWLGVGVGVIGFVAIFLLCLSSVERDKQAVAIIGRVWPALVLTLVFWGISHQTQPPFSPGQTLGWGFLIGGLVGVAVVVAASVIIGSSDEISGRTSVRAAHAMAFLGLFGASLTYSIFRGYPQDAMIGFALGVAMNAILTSAGSTPRDVLVELGMLIAVILAAGIVLAVEHFDDYALRMRWSLPILVTATVCIAAYVGTEMGFAGSRRDKPGIAFGFGAIVSAVLTIGLSAIYSWRIVGSWEFVGVIASGAIIAGAIAWLAAGSSRIEDLSYGLEAACIAMLMVTALVVVAFRLWAGLGIALGLTGAWSVVLPSIGLVKAQSADGFNVLHRALRAAVTFGLAVLLFRLFIQYYGSELGTRDLRVHYTFVGAVLGFIVSLLFWVWTLKMVRRSVSSLASIAWAAVLGFVAAASPMIVLALWGAKAVMGFLFGIAVYAASALVGGFAVRAKFELDQGEHLEFPFLIGSMLVAIQFTRLLLETELTRAARIWVLAVVLAVGLVWLIVSSVIAARKVR